MLMITKLATLAPATTAASHPVALAAFRFYTSKSTEPPSKPGEKAEPAFNTEVTKEELKKNIEDYHDFVSGKATSKTYVESHFKGFQSLKDKGEKTAEEQDRPEDFM